jgi:hypothetical protein
MNTAHALGHLLRTLPASAAATFLALFPIVDPVRRDSNLL